jgi:type II secretory pathway predicted ATPase ExeA
MDPQMFYGFTQMPFMKETKLKKLYPFSETRQLMNRLEYLQKAKGIGVFTGNAGTGKTSALREFTKSQNPALYKVIYIPLTTVTTNEFFREIADSLGLEPAARKVELFKQIKEQLTYLVKEKGCIPIILIDEAHYLNQKILNDLVMLLNFEMDSRDNCILILSGLSTLNSTLNRAANESLRQRIIINYHVEGIQAEEVKEYVSYVCKECGSTEPLFSEGALDAAVRLCQGSVRVLNRLLYLSLIEGANTKIRYITPDIIERAYEEAKLG